MSEYNPYNPIKTVDGNAVKCPSAYQWSLLDLSDSAAGRTEDTFMHKNRIEQKRKCMLEWHNITIKECSEVLQAFNPEYVTIVFLDALQGKYIEKTFYVGDRSAPMYNCKTGLWKNVSFSITEK